MGPTQATGSAGPTTNGISTINVSENVYICLNTLYVHTNIALYMYVGELLYVQYVMQMYVCVCIQIWTATELEYDLPFCFSAHVGT